MMVFFSTSMSALLLLATMTTNALAGPTIVYLTRHAERADNSVDSNLSDTGRARARNIAHMLRQAGITHIYTTNYARTRQTAEPLATALNIQPEVYGSPSQLAAQLKGLGGTSLVVAHSNTLPMLVNQLGGQGGTEVNEQMEFNRLYQVTIEADGSVNTLRMTSSLSD